MEIKIIVPCQGHNGTLTITRDITEETEQRVREEILNQEHLCPQCREKYGYSPKTINPLQQLKTITMEAL